MKETILFSSLLPSHPDLLPILKSIREKYNIPEIDPDDDWIEEILLSDKDINWKAVRKEIETQVRNSPAHKRIHAIIIKTNCDVFTTASLGPCKLYTLT